MEGGCFKPLNSNYARNTLAPRRASKIRQLGGCSTAKEKTAMGKGLVVRARAVMNGSADKGDISCAFIDHDDIDHDYDRVVARNLAARREIKVKAVVTRSPPKVSLAG